LNTLSAGNLRLPVTRSGAHFHVKLAAPGF